MSEEIDWYCRRCGQDLGDEATVASGDCVDCERILCAECFEYDERSVTVRCPQGFGCRRG